MRWHGPRSWKVRGIAGLRDYYCACSQPHIFSCWPHDYHRCFAALTQPSMHELHSCRQLTWTQGACIGAESLPEFALTGISSIYFRWAQINGRDLQSNLVTGAICDSPLGTLRRAGLASHHHFISLQTCSGWGATNNLNTECISAVLFMYSSVILWDERCHRTVNLCHCHYYLNWCFFNSPGSDIKIIALWCNQYLIFLSTLSSRKITELFVSSIFTSPS